VSKHHVAGLTGSITALATPFKNGRVDDTALGFLVERQIARGTSALVVCGTTGEAPTLDHPEQAVVIRSAVTAAAGRVPVIAGVGSNCTGSAIDQVYQAEWLGADGVLCVVPYYNKPTQEGLYQHFLAVQSKTSLPVLLYDVPSRTGVGLAPETVRRLADLPNVVGMKDASGDLTRMGRLRRSLPADFLLLSGDDATAPAALELGAQGCISVSSNVAPALCAALHRAWVARNHPRFRHLTELLMPLAAAMSVESNPIPVKWALARLGLMEDELRLPMTPLAETNEAPLRRALDAIVSHESEEASRIPYPPACFVTAAATAA
jgi:4-hydroxy-tetrahydrodipicolinate synthase